VNKKRSGRHPLPNRTKLLLTQIPRAVRLPLKYTVVGPKGFLERTSGSGETVDIVNGMLHLRADGTLPLGALVEVVIPWQIPLEGEVRLKLLIRGRVVQSEKAVIMLKIEQHEFRTAGSMKPRA